MELRVLLTGPGEPAHNMALDEALLVGNGPPTLRLYCWSPHAISLGYFQPHGPFAPLAGSTPLVRRLTGGGAIHHCDELTFSLCLGAELVPRDVAASYRLIHAAIGRALAAAGVPHRLEESGVMPAVRPDHSWCFAAPGRHDLVGPGGGKLLGSAQRRIRSPGPRILHHGSLVLRRPALTPFCAAVADTVDPRLAAPMLEELLPREIGRALGLVPRLGSPEPEELHRAADLRRQRYLDPAFTRGTRRSRALTERGQ